MTAKKAAIPPLETIDGVAVSNGDTLYVVTEKRRRRTSYDDDAAIQPVKVIAAEHAATRRYIQYRLPDKHERVWYAEGPRNSRRSSGSALYGKRASAIKQARENQRKAIESAKRDVKRAEANLKHEKASLAAAKAALASLK